MDKTSGDERGSRFTENTLVPISLVALVIASLIGGTWWLKGYIADTTYELRIINLRLQGIEDGFRVGVNDKLSGKDFDTWTLLLRQANPSLSVPDRPR